jgi:ketosteroid isomerase-like protein
MPVKAGLNEITATGGTPGPPETSGVAMPRARQVHLPYVSRPTSIRTQALLIAPIHEFKRGSPMSDNEQIVKQNKAVVDAYYQAGARGELTSFAEYVHDDFVTTAPNYLPWGGEHLGGDFFRDEVLPSLPDTLDFGRFGKRFTYESFTGEGSHVVALIRVGVAGTDDAVKISEHWEVKDGKALSIWVAYFEPQALLDKLGLGKLGR